MRIDFNQGAQPAAESAQSAAQSAPATSSAVGYTVGEDQAQLSGVHTQVEALAAQASQLPEVREERVQALRQAVESGRYHPSAGSVAGALLTHMSGPAA